MAPKKTIRTKGRAALARAKATSKISARSERKAPRAGGKTKSGPDNSDVTLEP